MNVLFCAQSIDRDDPSMSFFHDWVATFASEFETITVICLKKDVYSLPSNVTVYSLGKEEGVGYTWPRFRYVMRLLYLTIVLRQRYDRVFVHMNQEYILVSGILWKLMRKPIFLWYNHYSGSILTDFASLFCQKVFFTSDFAYTSKYAKSVKMPVGVDIRRFSVPQKGGGGVQDSILSLGRIAPSKKIEVFIHAIRTVSMQHQCSVSVYGPAVTDADAEYLRKLKELVVHANLETIIRFHPGVPSFDTPAIYASHSLFINCSRSGMYDKTIFEAAASGCIVIAASEDFRKLAGEDHYFTPDDPDALAAKIVYFLEMPPGELGRVRVRMQELARTHSLATLGSTLKFQMQTIQ